MALRVAINGLGRIGRCLVRLLHRMGPDGPLELVAANDLAQPSELAYLLSYDSTHGRFGASVELEGEGQPATLAIDGRQLPLYRRADAERLPWGEIGVDVVLECTGALKTRGAAAGHLTAGARRVLISAPSGDADAVIVPGVNDGDLDPAAHRVVSMASCTTNSLAPPLAALLTRFAIERASFTTVHAYTGNQNLLDGPHAKRRRGRAAALSIVPTSTGAASATVQVLPQLAGKLSGQALRVPTHDASATDLVAQLAAPTTVDEVHAALRQAADGPMRGVLRVDDDRIVSCDVIGDPHTAIVDAPSTTITDGSLLRLLIWYDNEWAYAARLLDLAPRLIG